MIMSNAVRATLFAALVLSFHAWADPASNPGAPQANVPRDSDQEKFQDIKGKLLENHQSRAAILQQAESCIQAATTQGQLKACTREERRAGEQLRNQLKQEWQSHH
jgi:hypothetical protein